MGDTTPAAENGRQAPEGYEVLTEGKASILQRGNEVFYNPAQVINRDMSIAVLRYFVEQQQEEIRSGKLKKQRPRQKGGVAHAPPEKVEAVDGIRVLEGLAASGLRSLRYAMEVEGVGRVDSNDFDGGAVEAMQRNVDFNGARAQQVMRPQQGDARVVMLSNAGVYDAVDLDPYGSPSQLLDSAVQAVAEGGLLMVTATDMAVLCGNNGEACWSKYGCYPLHRAYCHEQALRILLACLETHANRYKRHIVPVLSLSIDFYVRVFVRLYTSPAAVKESASKLAYLWQSQGCDSFFWQRVGRKEVKGKSVRYTPGKGPGVPEKCPETGAGFLMGGPLWAEPIHDPAWVKGVLGIVQRDRAAFPAAAKLHSILTAVGEELPDVPLYLQLHDICKTIHCTPPRAEVLRSAIVNAGYRVSSTHANPLGLKSDAPFSVVWDIMRCWVQQQPVKPQPEGSHAAKLLAKPPALKANFARASGAVSAAKTAKVARFLPNPEVNWGPRPKHGRVIREDGDGSAAGAGQENGEEAAAAEEGAGAGKEEAAPEAAVEQNGTGAEAMETAPL